MAMVQELQEPVATIDIAVCDGIAVLVCVRVAVVVLCDTRSSSNVFCSDLDHSIIVSN